MKAISLCFYFLIITGVILDCQNTNKEKWKIQETPFVKSFGDNCSIFVSEDYGVIREIISFEPSFEVIIFDKTSPLESIGRVFLLFTIEIIDDSNMAKIKDIDARLFNKNVLLPEDEIFIKKIKNNITYIQVSILKNHFNRKEFTFGTFFIKE